MIKRDIAEIEIGAEGKLDCVVFYVKIPHPIDIKYVERVTDAFKKAIGDFAKVIEEPEFWE